MLRSAKAKRALALRAKGHCGHQDLPSRRFRSGLYSRDHVPSADLIQILSLLLDRLSDLVLGLPCGQVTNPGCPTACPATAASATFRPLSRWQYRSPGTRSPPTRISKTNQRTGPCAAAADDTEQQRIPSAHAAGNLIRNVAPWPGVLSTSIAPP